jgi:hypothetical protein
MAILPNRSNWVSDVYAWEEDDPVEGGIGGLDNRPPQNLSDRTNFLKKQIDDAAGGDTASESDPPTLKGTFAKQFAILTAHGGEVDGAGRNLFDVLGVTSIPAAMAELRRRCNNKGEINSTKIPDFTGILVGDYIDGLDLSGIAAPTGGLAPQAWNDTYKNNRLLVSGFNTYKGSADTENAKNHLVFTFRNIIAKGCMRVDNTNDGDYPSSKTEARAYLEGASGDGSGPLAVGLKTALGGEYLYTVRRLLSSKGNWAWVTCTLFLLSEREVWGCPVWGEVGYGGGFPVQLPIFQKSGVYKGKRWNGARDWWWEETPSGSSSAYFCGVTSYIGATSTSASGVGGFAPAFCVA